MRRRECSLPPMAEVRIRRAGADELDRLEPLWNAMYDNHREVGPREFAFRSREESWRIKRARYGEWIEDPEARLFLAETPDGRAVGYAFTRVRAAEATVVTGRVGDLESLAVLPEHRGGGVGQALVAAVFEHFRDLGLSDWGLGVMEGNDRARAFYERLGLRGYTLLMLGRLPGA